MVLAVAAQTHMQPKHTCQRASSQSLSAAEYTDRKDFALVIRKKDLAVGGDQREAQAYMHPQLKPPFAIGFRQHKKACREGSSLAVAMQSNQLVDSQLGWREGG